MCIMAKNNGRMQGMARGQLANPRQPKRPADSPRQPNNDITPALRPLMVKASILLEKHG
jgi:hypothetical protein